MFLSKLRYPVAVDISGDHLYAVQMRGTAAGPVVKGLAFRDLTRDPEEEEPREEDLVTALKDVRKDGRFSGKKTVIHLPSGHISSFHIRVRADSPEMLEQAILRESEEYISFPLREAVIDYPSYIPEGGDTPEEYKVTITAVHRDYIDRYLRMFKRAGMAVEAVDFDVSSLIRLHGSLHPIPENPVVLCNIDDTWSVISIITDKGILAERHISWGFGSLAGKVRSNLGLPEEPYKTEQLLQKYGLTFESGDNDRAEISGDETARSTARALYQIIMPHIEDLVDEFHKMAAYLRSEERDAFIERIYMYGCANLIHGLDHYLEKRLNIPATLVNPLSAFIPDEKDFLQDPSKGSRFGPALGLALRRVPWL